MWQDSNLRIPASKAVRKPGYRLHTDKATLSGLEPELPQSKCGVLPITLQSKNGGVEGNRTLEPLLTTSCFQDSVLDLPDLLQYLVENIGFEPKGFHLHPFSKRWRSPRSHYFPSCMTGLEPATSSFTDWRSNQLSYTQSTPTRTWTENSCVKGRWVNQLLHKGKTKKAPNQLRLGASENIWIKSIHHNSHRRVHPSPFSEHGWWLLSDDCLNMTFFYPFKILFILNYDTSIWHNSEHIKPFLKKNFINLRNRHTLNKLFLSIHTRTSYQCDRHMQKDFYVSAYRPLADE